MKYFILAALVLVTAACGAYQFPGATPSGGTGTVSGHVIAVPCAPVEPGGAACARPFVTGVEVDFSDGGKSAAVVTDGKGAYSIDLPAGTWNVKLKTHMRIVSGPTVVSVAAGSHVVADYVLDTGIRVPVPQQ
jgi:type 1 fimbria pilin